MVYRAKLAANFGETPNRVASDIAIGRIHCMTTTYKQLPKWKEANRNMNVGQLVQIKNENVPPTYWPMGRITHTHAGSDGKVRSVTLKTQSGTLERSVRNLCALPTDIELEYWNSTEKMQAE